MRFGFWAPVFAGWLRNVADEGMEASWDSVSKLVLRPRLVGTPEQIREKIEEYQDAGLDLLLLQMSPQAEEMERFSAQVIRPESLAARAPELVA